MSEYYSMDSENEEIAREIVVIKGDVVDSDSESSYDSQQSSRGGYILARGGYISNPIPNWIVYRRTYHVYTIWKRTFWIRINKITSIIWGCVRY
jgi:hypothetical protein